MKQSEDHMDDLFRKAGENYPLRTDGADWDKVMARLQTGPESAPVAAREGERQRASRKLWWLLLLLFLPAGWLFSRYETGRGAFTKAAGTTASSTTVPSATVPSTVTVPSSATGSSTTAPSAATVPSGAQTGAVRNGGAQSSQAPATTTPFAAVLPARQNAAPTNAAATRSGRHSRYVNRGNGSFGSTPNDADGGSAVNNGAPGTAAAPASNPAPVTAPANDSSAAATATATTAAATTTAAKTTPATTAKTGTDSTGKSNTATAKAAPAKGRKRTPSKVQRGMYAGVVGGPDVSTIKWQEIQQPGFSVGLTLGYRFNRSLAIEADALWDHKVYYTDGQYFNKAKTDIPANVTITTMNGSCSMIELPLDLRWDFMQFRHGGGLFATAGFSSYLMKKESYSYGTMWRSVYSEGSRTYFNSGNDFFSIFQLSAGYTFKWDHVGDVRIEPYLKMPLRGVGIGSLPMTSTGIYIGITRPFR